MPDTQTFNEYIVNLNITGLENKIETFREFGESFFYREYQRSFQILINLLREGNSESRGFDCDDSLEDREFYNIITFTGARGTGKSSAMKSFAKALGDLTKNRDILDSGKFPFSSDIIEELKRHSFYILPCIDGSLLESGEDIFQVTLAQMYGELVYKNGNASPEQASNLLDYQKREVQKQFEEIYRSARKLDSRGEILEESLITSLKNLSSSLKIRKEFTELVSSYLKLLFDIDDSKKICQNSSLQRHLVISIDDLDMNIRDGYEMLEKIHRYLMVPGVIVLMTVDLDQLRKLCERSYYRMVPKEDEILKNSQKYIRKLARDYTDKVLPIVSRIYMPDFKDRKEVNINGVALKKFLFLEIYKKSGMRFDHAGKKWHFYIPETIRGLANFSLMLQQISDLERVERKDRWSVLESNYTFFLADIINRFVRDKLDFEQQDEFKVWTNNRLERTCMSVVQYASILAKNGSDEEKEGLKRFGPDYEEFGYSYGELLRSIYCWGRSGRSNKMIIHCILAYLSGSMTREYCHLLRGPQKPGKTEKDSDSREGAKETLQYIINGSVIGSWSNRILPRILDVDDDDMWGSGDTPENEIRPSTSFGAARAVNISKFQFRFRFNYEPNSDPSSVMRDDKMMAEYVRLFRSMEFFALFFSEKVYRSAATMNWRVERVPDSTEGVSNYLGNEEMSNIYFGFPQKSERHITVQFNSGIPDFNMYNFLSNLFDWKEKSSALEESLFDELFSQNVDANLKSRFLKKIGVRDEIDKWHSSSAGFALPLYNLDITYNLVKRLRQDRYGKLNYVETVKEYFNCFRETLRKTIERLEDSDIYYKIHSTAKDRAKTLEVSMQTKVNPSFRDRFADCPFVKWALNPENYLVSNYDSVFERMMWSIVTLRNQSVDDIDSPAYEPYD